MSGNFPHHSGGVLRVQYSARYGSVPEALLEDTRLDLDARAVAAWLAVKPDGWLINVKALRARIKVGGKSLGRDRWQRIARELENAGYLKREKINGGGGHWVWHVTFNPIPQATMTGFAGTGLAEDGPAGAGKPGHKVVPPVVNTIDSNTTTTELDASALEDLIEAAIWAEKHTRTINNESGFRHALRKRLAGAVSQEDLLTLQNWRAHLGRLACEESKQAAKTNAMPTSREEGRKRMAVLRASMQRSGGAP